MFRREVVYAGRRFVRRPNERAWALGLYSLILSIRAVLAILDQASGTTIKTKEWKTLRAHDDPAKKALAPSSSTPHPSDSESEGEEIKKTKKPSVRVPGKTAIAGVLIAKFAYRELDGLGFEFAGGVAKPKI